MRQMSEAIEIRREGSSMNGKGEWNDICSGLEVEKRGEKKKKKKETPVCFRKIYECLESIKC